MVFAGTRVPVTWKRFSFLTAYKDLPGRVRIPFPSVEAPWFFAGLPQREAAGSALDLQ